MKRRAATILSIAVLICIGLQPPAADAQANRAFGLLDGHRIVNVVDDFLLFWDRAKDASPRRQRRLWRNLVENRHRDYFDRAVYRTDDPIERNARLDEFLAGVPSQIDAIREFNKNITEHVIQAVFYFKLRFNEYEQQNDIYIGLSFGRFDGSVRAVHNDKGVPDTLCIGADRMSAYSDEHTQIAIAHELFHLYHFGFLFQQPGLFDTRGPHLRLMIEGMAVAGSEAMYPFESTSLYLGFTEFELLTQQSAAAYNSNRYRELIDQNAGPEIYDEWFSGHGGLDVLPRAGYYLGYEATRRVLESYTLEQMVRMTPNELREHAREQLGAITVGRVVLMAGR